MFTRQRQKDLARLHRKKERVRQGVFLVEGVRSVEAALEGGAALTEVLVTEATAADGRAAALLRRAEGAGVPVHRLGERDLGRITTVVNGQGVAAVARRVVQTPAAMASLEALLVLDGVQDPGNVGTLLRTAAWFGLEGVLAGPGTADMESPKVVRSAMGGLWDLALADADDLPAALAALQAAGIRVVAADLEGTPAQAWVPAPRTALVLGSEAHGVAPELLALADDRVTIRGAAQGGRGVESLNVGIAGGILLHRWRTQTGS